MDDRIELRLVGITYNQIESGVYALILEDVKEGRRLAIVIGYPEAQSIECHLQHVKTPRPLSHDLMVSLLNALDGILLRVDIHKLPSGPYAGSLTLLRENGDIYVIDARSSDAIALAIRVGAPIFTTRELLEEKGYSPQKAKNTSPKITNNTTAEKKSRLSSLSDTELHELLEKYVSEEKYEEAAEVKLEIEKRKLNS